MDEIHGLDKLWIYRNLLFLGRKGIMVGMCMQSYHAALQVAALV